MMLFTLNKQPHKLRTSWDDFTLTEAMKLKEVTMPDIDDWFELYQHLPELRALASHFTDADPDMIPPTWLVSWAVKYMLPIKQDLHKEMPTTYVPLLIDKFEHKGVTYFMPERLELGTDEVILQHSQTAQPFVEASNLLKAYSELTTDGIKAMSSFIACVVKEDKDEIFDEQRVIQRAQRVHDLPMPIVWEVFFCTSLHLVRQMSDTLLSSGSKNPVQAMGRVEAWMTSAHGRLQSRRAELQERLKQLTS
jgi:hypothetical protein